MAERTSAEYARCLRLSLTAGIDNPSVTLIMYLSFTHGACLISGYEQVVASKWKSSLVGQMFQWWTHNTL